MKTIIYIISITFSLNCFSQTPNPNLFQTWYLYDIYSSSFNTHYYTSTVSPAISPTLIFSSSVNYNGNGACNSYNGTLTFPANDYMKFTLFIRTLLICANSEQNSFESSFFGLFNPSDMGVQYFVSNMELTIITPLQVYYRFRNSPLNNSEFEKEQIVISPNPVESNIYIKNSNYKIYNIEILNHLGQNVKTVISGFEDIDVSDLASGIYTLKLISENNTEFKKIIKK
jgi:heat shock protein HslJ